MSSIPQTHADRDRRVEDIRAGARVRRNLGQAALYAHLHDGQHEVVLCGRRFTGVALDQVIAEARKAAPPAP